MPTSIITKHSTTSGDTPSASELAVGELAINLADGKLFTKDGSNEVIPIIGQGAEFLPEQYGAVGDGTTDDTTALQACFTAAIAAKGKVKLAAKTYKYAGLLATVTEGIDVEGSGDRTILLKADSYTGAAFELNNTFGQIGHFYPNSAGDQSLVADTTKMKSPSFSKFSIVGFSRNYAGFGFDFKDRNDMVSIQDVNCFNLKGSAFRFTGTFGNLRESNIRRFCVRMCGDENNPAVDLKMPSFSNTQVTSSTVSGKTRFTLTGTGDNFSGLTGNRKIRVQGSRLDGGTQEWPIESIISNTVVELPYDITTVNPETGENYGQAVTNAPSTFYRDVDGLNHIAFNDCQIVGCYGTYLRLSHDRVNFFRRVVFNNLMVHGSNNKYFDGAQQGPSGDLVLIEGGIGSVDFRGLRLNTNEVDKGVTPNILYAGIRVRSGRVITQDIPDRIWINDLDMLNLNNDGEAMFVVEKVRNLSVNGTVSASNKSGTELKVLADSITEAVDYNVVAGTRDGIRNSGVLPAFVIDSSVKQKVFLTENQRTFPASVDVRDYGVVVDGTTINNVKLQQAIDDTASKGLVLNFPDEGSFINTTAPVYVRSNSNWTGNGEIRNTNASTGLSGVCIMAGGFNPVHFGPYNLYNEETNPTGKKAYTQYPINAVNSGRTLTTSTASHAGNFATGDLVWVSTVKTWVGNAGDYPVTAHLSEVVSADNTTGVIVIDTPITEAMSDLYGGVQVCNAQEAAVLDQLDNPMEFCKYAKIDGISLTSDNSSAMARGGMYKCDFKFKDIRATNAIFANAFVNTTVKAQTVTVTRKLCDIAAYSNQFYVEIDSAIYDGSIAESNLPAFSRVGECSRNGTIEVHSTNCGGYIDPDPLVLIDSGCKNVSQVHYNISAPNHGEETGTGSAFRFQQGVSSNRQIYIVSPLWSGNTAFTVGDRVSNNNVGYQCVTEGTSAASGGPTGTGNSITDGTVVWKYVDNVAVDGQTVLNYGTKFDYQGADRTADLKVYLNNTLIAEGAGAGEYQKTDNNTTITLGTALTESDRVKIGLDSDYQKTLQDCWMSVNATLGGSAARGASISDAAQNANPPTVNHVKRCGFKSLNIEAPSTAFAETNQAVDIEGERSYIDSANISSGQVFVSSFADYATIKGYYEEGARNLSSNSSVRVSSKKGLLCDVGNQTNDQILVNSTSTVDVLTAVFPANSLYIDDRWVIKGTGRITGTNDEKRIIFSDGNTTFFTFVIPAGTEGNFTVELQLIAQSLAQYTAFGVLNVEGSDTVSYDTDTSIDLTVSNTFTVGANVSNVSDGIRFHNLDGVFKKPYHIN